MRTWYTKYIKIEEEVAYERLGWRLDRDALRDTPHGSFCNPRNLGRRRPAAHARRRSMMSRCWAYSGPSENLMYMHIISTPSEESGPDRYTNVYLTKDHIRYLQAECEKILKDE